MAIILYLYFLAKSDKNMKSICNGYQDSLFFDVLLTVHLSIILAINQLNAQNLLL